MSGSPPGPLQRAVPHDWEPAMRSALAAAARAQRSGDVPVGAVVLDAAGTVVGTGWNTREETGDPTAHAEVVAMREAAGQVGDGWRLTGATLVATLEPCPMCAGALVAARVARLVFGAWDPKAGAVGSVWDVVRDRRVVARPEVVGGVLAAESAELLAAFFAGQRAGSGPGPR